MLTKSRIACLANSLPDKGKPLIYIDFLEVCALNWVIPEIGRPGQFVLSVRRSFGELCCKSEQEGFMDELVCMLFRR